MSNDTPTPISDDDVVALAKAAFEQSRDDITHRAAEAPNAPRDLQSQQPQQPGITIDLGHKNIARLPDEVIDVIRAEIERCVPTPLVYHRKADTSSGLLFHTIFLLLFPRASSNANVCATSMCATMTCARSLRLYVSCYPKSRRHC